MGDALQIEERLRRRPAWWEPASGRAQSRRSGSEIRPPLQRLAARNHFAIARVSTRVSGNIVGGCVRRRRIRGEFPRKAARP